MLPNHGKMTCRECFPSVSGNEFHPHTDWKLINQPAAYGSSEPRYLVLGFSKGATQQALYERGPIEQVAFAKMRPRLSTALQVMGVLEPGDSVDRWIANPKSHFAFGSLIRCSASRKNGNKQDAQGNPVYATSGALIKKSFKEIPEVLSRCASRYLSNLPASLETVFVLGNDDGYVDGFKNLIRRLYPDNFRELNSMAYMAGNKRWVHLAHPSPANGHFSAWETGSGKAGQKMRAAKAALAAV